MSVCCFHFYLLINCYGLKLSFIARKIYEFILEFILREMKMADFERQQFEFGLEFVR